MGFFVKEQLAIYNAKGRKTHIILSVKQFKHLLERLEDAEDVKLMNEVEQEIGIPWEEAKKKIRRKKQ